MYNFPHFDNISTTINHEKLTDLDDKLTITNNITINSEKIRGDGIVCVTYVKVYHSFEKFSNIIVT